MKSVARFSLPAAPALALLCLAAPAGAVEMLDLYQARPIVTGTGEANRAIGFALALEDVLIKVSGDARLFGDPRAAAIDPAPLVASFAYRDRMEGIPIHDEQGSHDRPHDLTVTFDHDKIDAALRSLGDEPWTAPRPTLVVVLAVTNGDRSFMLSADGEHGIDMRGSLDNAAFLVNIPTKVPTEAALDAAGLSAAALPATDMAKLDGLAKETGGDKAIAGTLDFSDQAHGWLVDWRILGEDGRTYEWRQKGVSFDDAFRNALRGAAQVLSGHGEPD